MGEPTKSVKLIVGLGNPGPDYAATRHNAGAWLAEMLAESFHLRFKVDPKFNARVAEGSTEGKDYKILIPNTYMNHSGQPVAAISKYYQIPIESIFVAHDELDIPVGELRFKTGGGHGGHNGLRDIIHHLQSRDFHRLRIGIDHPGHKDRVHDYVLSRPSKSDEELIRTGIREIIRVFPKILNGQYQAVMNELHSLSRNA